MIFSSKAGRVYQELVEYMVQYQKNDNANTYGKKKRPKRHKEEAKWMANQGNSPDQCLTEITKIVVQEKLHIVGWHRSLLKFKYSL